MTDKEKLEKLKKLADAMYYAAQQLTTDASRLHKAMDEYHKFIIHECKEEPAIPDIVDEHWWEMLGEEPVSEKECMYSKDNYTDEDRKVLCDGCEEKCRFNKKKVSVSKDWSAEFDKILEPYKNSHNYKKLCLILRWWKSDYERWWHWKLNKKEESGLNWKDMSLQEKKDLVAELSKDIQKEEPASEGLGEYINELSKQFPEVSFAKLSRIAARVAKWQKEHIWKPADGDDLPEYEREVVVFTQDFRNDAGIMSVAIGHRPNPDGWDGKSLSTGKVEHYTPKTYDKGGWNIPNVKWWLDCSMPKEIEL